MPEKPRYCLSVVHLAFASWLALCSYACSEPAAAPVEDVVDPLLHLDATVTELPNWQGEDAKTTDTKPGEDGAVGCPEGATKADGSCCSIGLYFDKATSTCLPAGPSGCFTTGAEDPSACVPRWCFAYLDDNDKPCSPGPENCRPVTTACPVNAGAINIGCEAGLAPEPNCAPAGNVVLPSSYGAPVVWSDGAALPSMATLIAVEAPVAPGPVAAPTWCNNGAGAIIDATANPAPCVTAICAVGTRPNPANATACLDVAGPTWTCPPGFDVAGDACAPHPDDCTDPWGGVTPGANVVFVSAAAASGGDGTQAKPFQKVNDAVAALPTGGTVAIGAGSYLNTNITLTQPIALRGSCTKDVILQGAPGAATILISDKNGSSVSNITVTGGRYGIRAEGATTATVDHVYVHSAAMAGVYVLDGAALTVKNTFVLTTLPGDANTHGRGVDVQGATLDATNLRLSTNRDFGLYGADASITAKGLVVDGTLAQLSDNKHGFGIYVVGKSTFAALDLRVTGNRGYGVRLEYGVTASGNNWWIDQTLASGDQTGGIGLGNFTSSVKVTDLRVTKSRQHGIWVVDTGAFFSGHNVLVSDTQPQLSDGAGGQGIVVEGTDATAQLSGLHVQNSYAQGVNVAGKGAALVLDFALIANTQPRSSDKSSGIGLEVVDGAMLTLPSDGLVQIASSYTNGFLLSGATWTGGTVRVQDTQSSQANGQHGEGAVIESGAKVMDATLRVTNSHDTGIVVVSATTAVQGVTLQASLTNPRTSDGSGGGGILIAEGAYVTGHMSALGSHGYGLTLEGKGTFVDAWTGGDKPSIAIGFTVPNNDGHGGNGVQVLGGAVLQADGLVVHDSYGHGIFVYDPGSTLSAYYVEVSKTQANTAPGWGRGISISHGAKATLAGVRVQDSEDVGLFIADTTTTATVDDLEVDGGTRGVAVQNRAVVKGHRWRLQNNSEIGVLASGPATWLTLRDLAISGGGYGVEVHNLATARLSRVAVVGTQSVGLLVDGTQAGGPSSSLELFDARISDIVPDKSGLGHGVVAQAGGVLRIAGFQAHDWTGTGILAHSGTVDIGGGSLTSAKGAGIRVVDTDLKLSGSRVQAVSGVAWSQSGGASSVAECAFLDTAADSQGSSNGVDITTSATSTLARTVIAGMQTGGLVLVGAHVTGEGIRVSGNGEGLARENGSTDTWIHSLFFNNKNGDVVDPGDAAPVGLPGSVTTVSTSESP